MSIAPIARQLLVASSTHFAALSAGGVVGYPAVLLQQLQANDSIVELNLQTGSWIGSVHGVAGIPSILLLLLMQYRGRKLAFILSCIFITIGWIIVYLAQDITTLITGECCHGLGTNSLMAITFLSVTEMVDKKFRNTALVMYTTVEIFGIMIVGVLGTFLHWKTVGLIMSCPILIALPMGCAWIESPSWLAYKGRYTECERNFKILNGTDETAKKEFEALINAQMAEDASISFTKLKNTIVSRDFYMPSIHTLLLINVVYWGGGIPVIVYSRDMFIQMSGQEHVQVKLIMNILIFIGYNLASVLVRYISSKTVLISSMFGTSFFMIAAAITTILQSFGSVSKESTLGVYCILGFSTSWSLGASCLGFTIASEIMPVKYRGLGGCLFAICICVFHSSSLKAYPYLCIYINVWGVFLIYAIYALISILFIWKFVPDTANRTLQEIEDFYVKGHFKVEKNDEVDVPFIKSELK